MQKPSTQPEQHPALASRRGWLCAAGGGAMALACGGSSAFAAEPDAALPRYRIGCSGRSFHRQLPSAGKKGEMSVADFIRTCAGWNCDCVELLDIGLASTQPEYLLSLKREAFLQSVELSAMSVYTNFLKTDTKKFDEELSRIREWIDRTALLGAPLLVVFPGSKNKRLTIPRAIDLVSQGLKELAPYAQEKGVLLGIENHGMLVSNASEVLAVVDKVDHPWVGINLDTGNYRIDAYKNMSALASRAVNCHLKMDVYENGKKQPADLHRKFQILRQNNYRGRVVLQYELKDDPRVAVPKCLRRMQTLAGQPAPTV